MENSSRPVSHWKNPQSVCKFLQEAVSANEYTILDEFDGVTSPEVDLAVLAAMGAWKPEEHNIIHSILSKILNRKLEYWMELDSALWMQFLKTYFGIRDKLPALIPQDYIVQCLCVPERHLDKMKQFMSKLLILNHVEAVRFLFLEFEPNHKLSQMLTDSHLRKILRILVNEKSFVEVIRKWLHPSAFELVSDFFVTLDREFQISPICHFLFEESILISTFIKCAKAWGNPVYIDAEISCKQRVLTCSILALMSFIDEIPNESVTYLMNGVHERLGSTRHDVRILGMVVGEAVATRHEPKIELNFEIEEDVSTIRMYLNCKDHPDSLLQPFESVSLNTQKAAEVELGDSESEEEVQVPRYLGTAIKHLKQNCTKSLIESIISMIDSCGLFELKEHAKDLTKALVLTDFEDEILQTKAVLRVIARCPEIVSEQFSDIFFNNNTDMRTKYQILNFVVQAGEILSATKYHLFFYALLERKKRDNFFQNRNFLQRYLLCLACTLERSQLNLRYRDMCVALIEVVKEFHKVNDICVQRSLIACVYTASNSSDVDWNFIENYLENDECIEDQEYKSFHLLAAAKAKQRSSKVLEIKLP